MARSLRRLVQRVVVLLACANHAWAAAADSVKPNLVVILADDLGYGDLGCYANAKAKTPNLDGLAASGMRFTSWCVSQGACTPSRASLLTGRYANRIGLPDVLNPNAKIGLDARIPTLATVCKDAGYATGAVGKWHLGDAPEFTPTRRGFDSFWGLPYSNDMWPVNYDGSPKPTSSYPTLPIIENGVKVGTVETLADQSTLTRRVTEHAVDFIRSHASGPFFLYVAHPMPHVPIAASEAFRGKSGGGLYGDVIMEIDWSVGEILRALDQAGRRDDTLVVFLSDNGPWRNFGDHAGSQGPLREGKGSTWEGGVRVPCIMRWPGTVPAGSTCGSLITSLDLLPTFAALANLQRPQAPIDGVDCSALLRGDSAAHPRDEFLYYYSRTLEAVRKRNWKLHLPHDYRCYEASAPGKDGFPGPTTTGRTGLELYDLEKDPAERRNVADLHPDIVEELTKLAASQAR
jgi:arylsulfatase A-like enzyme